MGKEPSSLAQHVQDVPYGNAWKIRGLECVYVTFSTCPSVCCSCFALILTLKGWWQRVVSTRPFLPLTSLKQPAVLQTAQHMGKKHQRGKEHTLCKAHRLDTSQSINAIQAPRCIYTPSALSGFPTQRFRFLMLFTDAATLAEVLQNEMGELLKSPSFFKSSLAVRHYNIINHSKPSKFENLI